MSDFRNDILMKLKETDISFGDQNKFLNILDSVIGEYTITKMSFELMNNVDFNLMCVNNYLNNLEYKGYSKQTLNVYSYCLKNFALNVKVQFTFINKFIVINYLNEYKRARNVSNKTLDKQRGMIITFLKYLYKNKVINEEIELDVIKYEQKQKEHLTREELEKVRIACKDKRERFIVEFLYTTGCRVSEFIQIKVKNIDWHNREIKIVGKGNKERVIYFNGITEIYMKNYLESRNVDSEYLICCSKNLNLNEEIDRASIAKVLNNIQKRISIPKKLHPHILRHTFATLTLENGCPIEIIKVFLGHAHITTTTGYLTIANKNIRSSHERYVF